MSWSPARHDEIRVVGCDQGQSLHMPNEDDLWGTTLTALNVNVVERRLRMSAQAVNLGEASQLDLVLHGVSRLSIDRPDDNTWDFAEITEVHVKQDAGAVEVQVVLWVEPNGISATCESVEVLSL